MAVASANSRHPSERHNHVRSPIVQYRYVAQTGDTLSISIELADLVQTRRRGFFATVYVDRATAIWRD